MDLSRRNFFKLISVAGVSMAVNPNTTKASQPVDRDDEYGCLVDTTLCVGCRKCEQVCNQRHSLPNRKNHLRR